MGQAWPKFALSSFMRFDGGIVSAALVPSSVTFMHDGAKVTVVLETRYPFGDKLKYTVRTSKAVEFTLRIRIPGFADGATVDGTSYNPGTYAEIKKIWKGRTEIEVELQFTPKLVKRPRGLFALWRGPLLFSLPFRYDDIVYEYTKDGVERKFPYCDYAVYTTEKWNYAFASDKFTVAEHDIQTFPFAQENPPISIDALMREIPWSLKEGFKGICNEVPDSLESDAPPKTMRLVPYGSTYLRMTEMPLVRDSKKK